MVWFNSVHFSYNWIVNLFNFHNFRHDEYFYRDKRTSEEFLCDNI